MVVLLYQSIGTRYSSRQNEKSASQEKAATNDVCGGFFHLCFLRDTTKTVPSVNRAMVEGSGIWLPLFPVVGGSDGGSGEMGGSGLGTSGGGIGVVEGSSGISLSEGMLVPV
jgi:hypothetical protein